MYSVKKTMATIRRLLPEEGRKFRLCDAVDAMEAFCREDPLPRRRESSRDAEEDGESLVIVTHKQQKGWVEIGLYRNRDLFHQLELLLRFRSSWRSFLLKPYAETCEEGGNPKFFFNSFRKTAWYRRFAALPAASCSVDWHGAGEMAALYREIIPDLVEGMDPIF